MKNVQITINPTEVRSVKYVNNFSKAPGEKINLKVKSEVAIKLNPTNPVAAAVIVKCTVNDEESGCIQMEVETITGVIASTFIDNLDQYIKDNYMPIVMITANEKVRALSSLIGAPIRIPNPVLGRAEAPNPQ